MTTTTPKIENGEIPSLNGLRALSILLVLIGHTYPDLYTSHFSLRLLFLHADLGVRIFFIISGFLITTLLIRERDQFGDVSLRLFYARRSLRILPAFAVFVAAAAIANAIGFVTIRQNAWLYVLTYTVNFLNFLQLPGTYTIAHLWSLSVEEQFYLLWPLVVRFTKPRVWIFMAAAAIFAGIGVRAFSTVTGHELIDPILRFAFPFVCGPIAMGCLLALDAAKVKTIIAKSPALSGSAALFTVIPIVVCLDALDLGTANRFIALAVNALTTFCVARFIFIPTDRAGKLLNSPAAVLIGNLSYSLYLWQQLFIQPHHGHSAWWRVPGGLLATALAASISYYGIERRFLPLRKRFARKKMAFAQAAAA